MARRPMIAGNWKMNKGSSETKALALELRGVVGSVTDVDLVVAPPFTSLAAAADALAGSVIEVAAQNVHWAESGAYTAEISADMLTEIPVRLAIIGHSERRQYFGETDQTVNQRLFAALGAGLKPIVCVGESLEQREAGETHAVVERQVTVGLAGLTKEQMSRSVVAYEPVWAIGTGRTATPEQAQDVHRFIRSLLRRAFAETADTVRILYGGSVKPANAFGLMSQPDIDGGLVGGASLKAVDFAGIVDNTRKAYAQT